MMIDEQFTDYLVTVWDGEMKNRAKKRKGGEREKASVF